MINYDHLIEDKYNKLDFSSIYRVIDFLNYSTYSTIIVETIIDELNKIYNECKDWGRQYHRPYVDFNGDIVSSNDDTLLILVK